MQSLKALQVHDPVRPVSSVVSQSKSVSQLLPACCRGEHPAEESLPETFWQAHESIPTKTSIENGKASVMPNLLRLRRWSTFPIPANKESWKIEPIRTYRCFVTGALAFTVPVSPAKFTENVFSWKSTCGQNQDLSLGNTQHEVWITKRTLLKMYTGNWM